MRWGRPTSTDVECEENTILWSVGLLFSTFSGCQFHSYDRTKLDRFYGDPTLLVQRDSILSQMLRQLTLLVR
jgi:hypothetical protein